MDFLLMKKWDQNRLKDKHKWGEEWFEEKVEKKTKIVGAGDRDIWKTR